MERFNQLYSLVLKVIPAYGLFLESFMSVHNDLKMYTTMINKSRSMIFTIPDGLKKQLKPFLKWKKDPNEPTGKDDFLFIGQRGVITVHVIQQIFKKYPTLLIPHESGESIHSLRVVQLLDELEKL